MASAGGGGPVNLVSLGPMPPRSPCNAFSRKLAAMFVGFVVGLVVGVIGYALGGVLGMVLGFVVGDIVGLMLWRSMRA